MKLKPLFVCVLFGAVSLFGGVEEFDPGEISSLDQAIAGLSGDGIGSLRLKDVAAMERAYWNRTFQFDRFFIRVEKHPGTVTLSIESNVEDSGGALFSESDLVQKLKGLRFEEVSTGKWQYKTEDGTTRGVVEFGEFSESLLSDLDKQILRITLEYYPKRERVSLWD